MSEEKTKYCPYCGAQIEYRYGVCPSCGKPQPTMEGVERVQAKHVKNPLLALFLSLLVTGIGQIYLGRVGRGLFFLASVLLMGILLEGVLTFDQLMLVGLVFSIISAWDAYRIANEINRS
ncbi:MAG: hypothetical protein Q8O47_01630 [Candidatus Bathyarchaeota archaeon]|jgi:TM2 domain-containing membrane protein YozV|nr:hypothetical protein [Candidatus Bathyarchaeota archaeon]